MSAPIALGRPSLPLSPHSGDHRPKIGRNIPLDQGDGVSVLTAPITPGNRMPVVDKSKVDPQTLKAAQGMEAMFLDYMMKVMRETVPKNDMDLESPATNIYRSMMDSETAQKAARAGGVGLADQIVAYLEGQRYNLPKSKTGQAGLLARGHGVPANDPTTSLKASETSRTGGTHEGQSTR